MHKTAKAALIISITVVFTISSYFMALSIINNHTKSFSPENFYIFRYSVPTGPYAGLGVIRIEYIGSEPLPGNLTIQAKYKDTGGIVSGESFRVGIETGWRTEIPVYRPSDAKVAITITYDGESIVLTA